MINLGMIKIALRSAAHGVAMFTRRNLPHILTFGGLAGGAATVVVACKATSNARDVLDEKDEQLNKIEENLPALQEKGYSHEDYEQDKKIIKRKTTWRLIKMYIPAATMGAASAALILSGHHMLGKRVATATAAYKAAETAFHAYRERVVNELGADVDEKFRDGLAVDRIELSERMKSREEKAGDPRQEAVNTAGFGEFSYLYSEETCGFRGTWKDDPTSNLNTLLRVQSWANDRLKTQGYLFINDVLHDLGIEGDTRGSQYGWIYNDGEGFVDFGLNDLKDAGVYRFLSGLEPNVWLTFNAQSKPINDQIDKIVENRKIKLRKILARRRG